MVNDGDEEGGGRVVVTAGSYTGPIPHPAILQQYEQVLPGAAQEIVQMAVREQAHRPKSRLP